MSKMKSTGSRRGTTPTSKERGDESSETMHSPLHEAFLDEVADIYNAEQQLIKALPRMAKAVQAEELRSAIDAHLQETEEQARRLEEVMETIGETLRRKKCRAMEGLLAEGKELLDEYKGDPALDAVVISAAQKIEHYEIASYGTLCAWAQQMGHTEALDLLQESLSEEKAADEKLTNIAEDLANLEAEQTESD